jgi:hypothetical protein
MLPTIALSWRLFRDLFSSFIMHFVIRGQTANLQGSSQSCHDEIVEKGVCGFMSARPDSWASRRIFRERTSRRRYDTDVYAFVGFIFTMMARARSG